MTSKDTIACPHCKKEKTWQHNNPFRPFCSKRCKLIDLGDWAAEAHQIPGDPVNPEDLFPSTEDDDPLKKT